MRQLPVLLLLALFTTLGSSAQQQSCACCTAEHRQFDFWLGEWNTYRSNGKMAGTNSIVLLQDSCILQENWVSSSGNYSGTSYNYYDAASGMWNQVWIDNQGGSLILKGRRQGNKMILSSDPLTNDEGNSVVNRITWTANEDGTVRQLWESKTGDAEWVVLFDGLYKRKTGSR